MTIPSYVCENCPLDDDAFYSHEWESFLEHLQTQHNMTCCRTCGALTGLQFDGWCRDCFIGKFSD